MDILKTIDRLWLDGDADRVEDGSARLIRSVKIGGKDGQAMVYTDTDFALIVFSKPVDGSPAKSEYRNVLVDSMGHFGRRGNIYADITTKGVRKAVPGVRKYIQPCADIMAVRVDKRFVSRDYSEPRSSEPRRAEGEYGSSRYGDR